MGEGGHAADQGGCHRRYSVSTFNRDISGLLVVLHLLPPFGYFYHLKMHFSVFNKIGKTKVSKFTK